MRNPFSNHPKGPHLVDGSLLNKAANETNANMLAHQNVQGGQQISGTISQAVSPPQMVVGIAVITSDLRVCGEFGSVDEAPCGDKDKYLARFRWHDSVNDLWQESDQDLNLDAGAYWEGVPSETPGIADETAIARGIGAETRASKNRASGIGYGQIPVYRIGDVVPCYWDYHRGGWLIPIQSAHEDITRYYNETLSLSTVGTSTQLRDEDTLVISVDIRHPGEAPEPGTPTAENPFPGIGETVDAEGWTTIDHLFVRIEPGDPLEDYRQTVFGHVGFPAKFNAGEFPRGTQLRFRSAKSDEEDDMIYRIGGRVELYQVGRRKSGSAAQVVAKKMYPGNLIAGFSGSAQVQMPGRFRDTEWVAPVNGGIFTFDYEAPEPGYGFDPYDEIVVGARYQFTISAEFDNLADEKSSESSPSSQDSFFIPGEGEPPDEEYCCCVVVTNVECDALGHVTNVCYSSICFPNIPGMECDGGTNTQCGAEFCIPCVQDMSSESSLSSLSSLSSSTPSSVSSISSSSSIVDPCPEFTLETGTNHNWTDQNPVYAGPGDPAQEFVLNLLRGTSTVSQDHWDAILAAGQLFLSVESTNASGTITLDTNTGVLHFEPAEDDWDKTLTFSIDVCDGDPDISDVSESSMSSVSSWSSIKSDSSLSSVSSASSVSSLSSVSSMSLLSSMSSSSSSLSSSSVSSSSISSSSLSSSSTSTSSWSTPSLISEISSFSSLSSSSISSSSLSSSSVSSSSISSSSLSSSSLSSSSLSSSTLSSLSSPSSPSSSSSWSSMSSSSVSSSSLSSSSLSSSSISSSSWSSISSSSPADDCPECVNCISFPDECEASLWINDLQFGPGHNHTNFQPSPSAGEPLGGVMAVEILYSINGIPGNFEDTFIAFNTAAELAEGIKIFLGTHLGGAWTVTVSESGGEVTVTDVSALNATHECDQLSFIADGGAGADTDHTFDTPGYEDPFISAAKDAVAFDYVATSSASCVWEVSVPLVTGSGTGSLVYTATVTDVGFEGTVVVKDNNGTSIARADFTKSATGPHDCGVTHTMTKISDWSEFGPTDGLGPGPERIADWNGTEFFDMNHVI